MQNLHHCALPAGRLLQQRADCGCQNAGSAAHHRARGAGGGDRGQALHFGAGLYQVQPAQCLCHWAHYAHY
eukprot:7824422-Ditylum_brightwellii.AAC.1